jgi:hypothetical protein
LFDLYRNVRILALIYVSVRVLSYSTYIIQDFVGRPEGKRPLGRPRLRWEDSIKMDLQAVGWEGVDWIDMAQDRDRWRALVNAVMNLRVP